METLTELLKVFVIENTTTIIWILLIIFGGQILLTFIAKRIVSAAREGNEGAETGKEKRAKTLSNLLIATGKTIIFIVALISTLQMFGIDPVPILAGASVLGFAVGFGAQTLIKDFFAGLFIFIENQFAVGDNIKIGMFEGRVQKMSIRSTVISDKDGNLIFIPNGSITSVINYSLGEYGKKKNQI